ncbi:excalibur calcium-binding domain-containing protein [Corynebacterium pseudogenitalium]|uniref:excalibur calcium-binding domain-containing protein n=1 Tax=Corynebacterium pseudogenitalium TaxID=38303 RepID=UPI00210DEA1F|nr:excalibur calcium-binding domain-containing protein [Corynebacterium pseudogenitalium]MCQ4607500.1 excalibur calcium-binding domain-containing protein [Corynebacterium pseudogenitalium]
MSYTTQPQPQRSSSKTKTVFAWITIALGIILLFSGEIGGILLAAAFVLPGAWWLRCEAQDKKHYNETQKAAANHEQLRKLLDPQRDSLVLDSMGNAPQFTPVNRRWPVVWLTALVLFISGGSLIPESESTPDMAPTPTSAAPTTTSATSESTSAATTTTHTSTTSTTHSSSSPSSVTTEETTAGIAKFADIPAEEPAQAPAPEPVIEQPVPAAPAPAPARVYYANCSEARAAGAAPIYEGQPGYSRKLDRDGDGIACE